MVDVRSNTRVETQLLAEGFATSPESCSYPFFRGFLLVAPISPSVGLILRPTVGSLVSIYCDVASDLHNTNIA